MTTVCTRKSEYNNGMVVVAAVVAVAAAVVVINLTNSIIFNYSSLSLIRYFWDKKKVS